MTEDDFIASSVDLQIGGFRGPLDPSDAGLARTLARCSGMAVAIRPDRGDVLVHDVATGAPRQVDPAEVTGNPKVRGAMEQIGALAPDFPYIIDMQDRSARSLAPAGEPVVAVFTFNRLVGDSQRILWPLPGFHDFGVGQFVDAADPGAVPWADKTPALVWRGITGGRARLPGPTLREGMRLKMAVRRFAAGALGEAQLGDILMACPRYRILAQVSGDPRYDMGFVDGDGYVIARTPLHAHLERPRLTRPQMQRHRFIAVLRGLDVGSSFYWVMNSGSTGFVMDTPFETFASGHFRAGEHFVPFAEDGSDLDARLDWAIAHDADAQAMAGRAARVCALLARPDLRAEILRRVVARIAALPRSQAAGAGTWPGATPDRAPSA